MKSVLGVFFFVLFVIIFLGLFYYSGYNKLQSLHSQVDLKWNSVERILKSKAETVQSLVKLVESNDNIDSRMLEKLSNITSSLMQSNAKPREVELDKELNKNTARLFVNIGTVPELKGDEKVEQLMGEIANIDNELIQEANSYNSAAQLYNKTITSFPYNLIASKMGLRKMPYFEVERLSIPPVKEKNKPKTKPKKKRSTPPLINVQQT